jgi:hypothetical protein
LNLIASEDDLKKLLVLDASDEKIRIISQVLATVVTDVSTEHALSKILLTVNILIKSQFMD